MAQPPAVVTMEETNIQVESLAENPLSDIALDFFVRMRAPQVSATDRDACARWLAASPAHQAAWDEIAGFWAGLDGVDVAGLMPSMGQRATPGSAASRHHVSRRQVWRLAAAAAVGGAGLAGWSAADPGLWADYRTGRGERQAIALPDGSAATLDARSALSLDFDGSRRSTRLHAGRSYFDVTEGDARPFVVTAGAFSVTAMGTAFEMRHGDGEQSVTVAAGEVDVSGANGSHQRLGPGESIRQIAGEMQPASTILTAEIAAWRQDRIIFHRTPLSRVAAELERYRNGYLIVTDAKLGAREVSGVFDSRRTDQALETIASTMSARLLRISDLVVLIQPAG